jgi:isoamylase
VWKVENEMEPRTRPGKPLPIGPYRNGEGVNFSIFSRNATAVRLELYEGVRDGTARAVIPFDSRVNRTEDIWHIWIEGIQEGQLYAFRVDGPYLPGHGLRFNKNLLLLDPSALALAGTSEWDFRHSLGYDPGNPLVDLSCARDDNARWMPKCCIPPAGFDWEGTEYPRHSWPDTVIYETHVRGFTVHPSSGVSCPGTFRGLVEKIPYLTQLGITAVELLPVQEFNSNEPGRKNPATGEPLRNYWGYDTVSFFAPKEEYSSVSSHGSQVLEFKWMVRELHRAGIEVILDIAINHTAEGNELGPTLNFRGIDNLTYYILDEPGRYYMNFTGTGNTLNCSHPVVRDFILTCLRHWVTEYRIDGFRFDLASILGRDEEGKIMSNPPLLDQIAEDPILRHAKLIAEAWDAGGAYQVGSFPGKRWSEWNGQYRDDIRRFWRGDPGMTGRLASRICGSADLYQHSGKEPLNSINFITCHDGFTLHDLVSYRTKHNTMNGENNRDGADDNYSDNYGAEGETDDPAITAIRFRQMKNMLATLFVSRGVPMVLGGDEFGRTQSGNNNAYCQDNEVSWYDWDLVQQNAAMVRFAREMIAFRTRHPVLRLEKFYTAKEISFFGPGGSLPDWDGPGGSLGCLIVPPAEPDAKPRSVLCLLFNAIPVTTGFLLPDPPEGTEWHEAVNTYMDPLRDIRDPGREVRVEGPGPFRVRERSLCILVSKVPGS